MLGKFKGRHTFIFFMGWVVKLIHLYGRKSLISVLLEDVLMRWSQSLPQAYC